MTKTVSIFVESKNYLHKRIAMINVRNCTTHDPAIEMLIEFSGK